MMNVKEATGSVHFVFNVYSLFGGLLLAEQHAARHIGAFLFYRRHVDVS